MTNQIAEIIKYSLGGLSLGSFLAMNQNATPKRIPPVGLLNEKISVYNMLKMMGSVWPSNKKRLRIRG